MLTFKDADGVQIAYRRWRRSEPRAVVVIAHGASEHSGRYERFALALNAAGFAAYAPDQRGHGHTADATGPGRMGPGGGGALVGDLDALVDIANTENPGAPVIAFGHSMGSMIMLAYATQHADRLSGVALCGFPAPMNDGGALLGLFQGAVDAGQGDEPAAILEGFNAPFEPARTPFDWLSRDPAEVDAYISDPFCGANMPLTFNYFVDVFSIVAPALEPAALGAVSCPALVIAGAQDPAAGMGLHSLALADALGKAGVAVTSTIYPDARHELLNETNRDAVTADVVAWMSDLT
jgi:alpha-beta hydrolase superfamily lysophospholipase